MNRKKLTTLCFIIFFFSNTLFSQSPVVNREQEKKNFASLHFTEKRLGQNIKEAYESLSKFAYLIKLAKEDRLRAIQAEKEPHNFRHDFKALKYVPWRNNIRYVKEGDKFILNSFGKVNEIKELINERVTQARANNILIDKINFQAREGIEFSQFSFIYAKDSDKTRAVGAQRKWLSLYFNPNKTLALSTLQVEYNNLRRGVKEIELIIDPSPTDNNLDDLVIVHRYNQGPAKVYLVGMMYNNKSFNNRNNFKIKYNNYLRNKFLQMFQRVAKYNNYNSHEGHKKHFERLERGLEY